MTISFEFFTKPMVLDVFCEFLRAQAVFYHILNEINTFHANKGHGQTHLLIVIGGAVFERKDFTPLSYKLLGIAVCLPLKASVSLVLPLIPVW